MGYSGNSFLLIKRRSPKFYDGWYALVAGHVEPQETLTGAMLRELEEEVGVSHIKEADLTLISLLSRVYEGLTYHDVIFAAPLPINWPLVLEVNKVGAAGWFRRDALPQNTIPYVRDAVQRFFASPQAATVHSYSMVAGELLL